jgi:hypothetical protein
MYKVIMFVIVMFSFIGCGGAVETVEDALDSGTINNITPVFNYSADSGCFNKNNNPDFGTPQNPDQTEDAGNSGNTNQQEPNDAQTSSGPETSEPNSNDCDECNSNHNQKPVIDGIYVVVFDPDSFNPGTCLSYRDADTYKLTDNKDGTALLQIKSMNKNCLGDFEKNVFSASCDITNETTGDQSYFSDYVKLYVALYFDYDFNTTLKVNGKLLINGGCSVYRKVLAVRQPDPSL